MNIDGNTKIIGLIGHPISHSKSYMMQNAAIFSLGFNAAYLPFPCPTKEMLQRLIPAFYSPSFVGANITTPHKQAVIPLLDRIDDTAQKIGAVNTIVKDNTGFLIGKNSDANGFLSSLQEESINPENRDILILGAGGAARAVAHALSPSASSIIISNRTRLKALDLINNLKEHYPEQIFSFCPDPTVLSLPTNALIVQCTSLGNNGELPPHPKLLSTMSVVDLLYAHTPLLQKATNVGATIQNGTAMLMHQAALSFSWWFHTHPPIDIMRSTLRKQRSLA